MNNKPSNSDQLLCGVTCYSVADKLCNFFIHNFHIIHILHSRHSCILLCYCTRDTLVYYSVIVLETRLYIIMLLYSRHSCILLCYCSIIRTRDTLVYYYVIVVSYALATLLYIIMLL